MPSLNPVLVQALSTGMARDRNGNLYKIHSALGREKGMFLWQSISDNDVTSSLEIGCAYGISSHFICDALTQKSNASHLIIDPYQSTHWSNVGIDSLARAGFSRFRLIESPSEIALARLLEDGHRIDFAFIDGLHRFENVMVDFFISS